MFESITENLINYTFNASIDYGQSSELALIRHLKQMKSIEMNETM